MLLAVHLSMIAVLLLLGFVFRAGKGAWLIAGYNTMSAAKKKEYDEKALCRFMAKLMFALALAWSPIAASALFDRLFLLWIGLGLFMAVVIVGVVFMNSGERFKKNTK